MCITVFVLVFFHEEQKGRLNLFCDCAPLSYLAPQRILCMVLSVVFYGRYRCSLHMSWKALVVASNPYLKKKLAKSENKWRRTLFLRCGARPMTYNDSKRFIGGDAAKRSDPPTSVCGCLGGLSPVHPFPIHSQPSGSTWPNFPFVLSRHFSYHDNLKVKEKRNKFKVLELLSTY